MAAPTKFWTILPVQTSQTYPNTTVVTKYSTELDASTAAVKAALATGFQHVVLEATKYAEPTLTPEIVASIIQDIPDPV